MKTTIPKSTRFHWLCIAVLAFAPACKKDTQPGKKLKQSEIMQVARREREAVLKFVKSARLVFEWRLAQPPPISEAERRLFLSGLLERLDGIPVKDLPNDIGTPWEKTRASWKELAANPNLDSEEREQGAQAAAELNQALRARGLPDLHF